MVIYVRCFTFFVMSRKFRCYFLLTEFLLVWLFVLSFVRFYGGNVG